jgi:hypothetical protein
MDRARLSEVDVEFAAPKPFPQAAILVGTRPGNVELGGLASSDALRSLDACFG